MTVVAIANYGHGLLVVADTQVSYRNGNKIIANPRFGVQKIFAIDSSATNVIFGFSGQIAGAKEIFNFLKSEKIKEFSSRLILPHLHLRICRWIEELTLTNPSRYSGISIIMCGVEKGLWDVSKDSEGRQKYLPFPRKFAYTYFIAQDGKVVQSHDIVIGGGNTIYEEVINQLYDTIGVGLGLPDADKHRTKVALGFFSLLFRRNPIAGVGPPYTGIFISNERSILEYEWEFDILIDDIQFVDNGIVKISCSSDDCTRTIIPLTLWDDETLHHIKHSSSEAYAY